MTETKHPLVYRGSVKNIYRVKAPRGRTPGRYLFEFTDDYSVFDYGKMPDRIRGKGSAIAMMSAFLFEEMARPASWRSLFRWSDVWARLGGDRTRTRLMRSPTGRRLAREGLPTHYLGMVDEAGRRRTFAQLRRPTHRILVKAVPVNAPERLALDGRTVWDYSAFHPGCAQFLIPLESVFRFGVPRGSSLLERLRTDPGYLREIGLERAPREGEWLSKPVVEFFSKLEPMDRHLSLEAAMNFSGLGGTGFVDMTEQFLLAAIYLYDLFLRRGLDLWDGKLEFVKSGDQVLLADSITPDELRITHGGTQLSKEPLRQYYKKNDKAFQEVLKAIKTEGPATGSVRRQVRGRLGRGPRKLDPDFRRVVEQMYRALTYRITGSRLFEDSRDLDEVVRLLRSA